MQDYQQRVVEEQKALQEKVDKLKAFLQGEVIKTPEPHDQVLLKEQHSLMVNYDRVLLERIDRFPKDGSAPHDQVLLKEHQLIGFRKIAASDV